jgi:transcriptional regulator with XRE-family HTH domain
MDLGLRVKQAALLLACDATTVANWEKGRTSPGTTHWPKVLDLLGYDPRPPDESIGEQLKRHRETRGWSQAEVAARLGVTVSVLWRWESGRRKPRGGYLARVYALLGEDPRPAPVTVGDQLKRYRERFGLTLTVMAARLGVAQSTLCRWETRGREPAGEYMLKVESVLRDARHPLVAHPPHVDLIEK